MNNQITQAIKEVREDKAKFLFVSTLNKEERIEYLSEIKLNPEIKDSPIIKELEDAIDFVSFGK